MFDSIKSFVGDRLLELTGVLVMAIASGVGLFFWQRGKTVAEEVTAPPADGTHFSILVAQLESDADGSQTRRVVESLEEHLSHSGADGAPVVHVLRYPKALKLGRAEVSGAVAKAETKGQTWLERKHADVLVWGNVSAADQVLRLRFLPRERAETDGSGRPERYKLGEKLELPLNFHADLGAVIAVSAAVSIQPVFDGGGRALADVIEPVVTKLAPLAANMPAAFAGETKAALWHAYAAGEQQLGEERGDNARLEKAAAHYRKALGEWTREKAPLQWATVQNNLGTALVLRGEREGSPARLNEAAAAFREALKELTRERVPQQWAMTQGNLGAALFRLGERESGTAKLEEAVVAFRAALEVGKSESEPLSWVNVQVDLGSALLKLGERQNNLSRLEESVTTFRALLDELPRSDLYRIWAVIQNNLGIAFRMLGDSSKNLQHYEESIAAFRAALEEYTRERLPLDWAMAQNNLGNALGALGKCESGTERFEEAITAYRAALEEYTRERVPLEWARTQMNLGTVLLCLGERENNLERIVEAITAFRASLEERTRERVPLQWATTQNSLGAALSALAECQAEEDTAAACASLKEARAAYLAALGEYVRAGASQQEDDVRRNIGQLGRLKSRLGCEG